MPDFLDALIKEIELEKDYLAGESIQTIYFGGGTPSVLNAEEVDAIIQQISLYHEISSSAEITLECNPDDLNPEYIRQLAASKINRLSIGIQSFDDRQLKAMNRRHSAEQALAVVKGCQLAGFDNISIDLIYGLPGMSLKVWQQNIQKALDLKVQHISAYHLTYEKGTVFSHQLKKGNLRECDEESSNQQFDKLLDMTGSAGFEHYEISNFALPGLHSQHNSNYWKQVKYLGLGPAAHSFNQTSRHWNVSHNNKYTDGIMAGKPNREIETIDKTTRYNEYLMTSLRTMWGVDLEYLMQEFGGPQTTLFEKSFRKYIDQGKAIKEGHFCKLTRDGFFISDKIISDLFES